ncbi:MAG: transposase [Desulfobacterales bacterium]|nr:transposase [Desulfobacterales bacterium]
MLKRILSTGVSARYLLMDSWFTMPATVVALARHMDVIGMVKKSSRIHYSFNGQSMDIKSIYPRLTKRRGCARIVASANVMLKDAVAAKLVFVRDNRKKDWLALLSTDANPADEDIVRIYGKRWGIEVFFKMAKEIQCRDFDALIAHTSIVFMRYIFLEYQCLMETDHRSFGDLFYACCEEVADISFMEALYRILTLVVDQLKQLGTFCEKTAAAFFDAIMNTALQYVGLSKSKLAIV